MSVASDTAIVDVFTHEARQLLDNADQLMHAGNVLSAIRLLCEPLTELWTDVRDADQRAALLTKCRQHSLFSLIQRDPFTSRAAIKPRGYAGDAVMMDYLYQGIPQDCDDDMGKHLFACTTRARRHSPSAFAASCCAVSSMTRWP